jgi:hypothetical protein
VALITNKPAWLNLKDLAPPTLVRAALDGKPVELTSLADLGWIEAPRRLTLEFRDAENPLDASGLGVTLNGKAAVTGAGGDVKATAIEGGKGLSVEVDLERALASEKGRARRNVLQVSVADRSVDRRETSAVVSYLARVPLDPNAIYLSDLTPVKAFAHGGLIRDHDYVGNVAEIAGRVYPKCLTLCPEVTAGGNHAEVVYQLPAGRGALSFLADLGVSSSARAYGSVTFTVQRGDSPDGPWEDLYASPTMRGGEEPAPISLALGATKYLRLYTTDAGDGINSDHALWGDARLK